jgi:hypothetical protein
MSCLFLASLYSLKFPIYFIFLEHVLWLRLLTTEARVNPCGICGGQIDTGTIDLLVTAFWIASHANMNNNICSDNNLKRQTKLYA